MATKNVIATPVDKENAPALPKGGVNIPRVNNPPQNGDATTPAQPPVDTTVPATTMSTDPNTPPAGAGTTTLQQQTVGAGNLEGYNAIVEAMKAAGGAANALTQDELLELYKSAGVDPNLMYEWSNHGGYTQNRDTALAGGGTGQPVESFYRDGEWYYYDGQGRPVKAGTSGRDEYAMSDGDLQVLRYAQTMYTNATTPEDQAYWHDVAERLRAKYKYSGGADGSMYIPLAQLEIDQAARDLLGSGANGAYGAAGSSSGGSPSGYPDTPEGRMQAIIDAWKQAAQDQANGQIDYATQQAIAELERALQDAQPQFKETAESISAEEQDALDNAALYAELRGDRGGIGQEQYNSIQNTAAQNRLAVQQAQTKLSTDTARQIADLRAQGEFEKADKALEITQQYLAQLLSLEQWAAEFNMTQEQFQASLSQWQAEYDMAMTQIGIEQNRWEQEFNAAQNQWQQEFQFAQDKFNYDVGQAELAQTAEMGWMLFNAGQIDQLTDEQLAAMKFGSRADAQAMYDALTLSQGEGSTLSINRPEDAFSVLYSAKFTKESDPEVMAAYLTNRGVDSKLAPSYVTEFISSGYDNAVSSAFASEGGWAAGYSNNVSGGSYKGTEWGAIKNTVIQNLTTGNFDAVTKYMDQIAGGLNEEQFLELMDLFAKYGYSPYSAIN